MAILLYLLKTQSSLSEAFRKLSIPRAARVPIRMFCLMAFVEVVTSVTLEDFIRPRAQLPRVVPYYMKFWRHLNLAILKNSYLAAHYFSVFSQVLEHKSLNFRDFTN